MQGSMSSKVLTGVAHRNDRVQVTIQELQLADVDILESIAESKISIDLINIFPTYRVFTIDIEDKAKLIQLLERGGYEYNLIEGCSKVTAIGERMTGVPGVMAKIIRALTRYQIEILQTADSLTTIGCLIHEEHLSSAINALHEEFGL